MSCYSDSAHFGFPVKKMIYFSNGRPKKERWMVFKPNGEILHRLDGPASTEWDKFGRIVNQNWCINGKLHREDGPALIEYIYHDPRGYSKSSYEKIEQWFCNDKLHRNDGPASISYYPPLKNKDRIKSETWVQNGLHQNYMDEPSSIIYWENGLAKRKLWIMNGGLFYMKNYSRKNGPAIINYDELGNITKIDWVYMGTFFTKKVNKWIKLMELPPWDKWTKDEELFFRLAFNLDEVFHTQ